MQTWVTLAAKHATLATGIGLGTIPAMGWDSLDGVAVGFLLAGVSFAAVNSSRQLRSVPLSPPGRSGPGKAEPAGQQAGARTRMRRRVDGVLTSMLKDDTEHPVTRLPALMAVPSVAEPLAAGAGSARSQWDKDYAGAIVAPARSSSDAAAGDDGLATGGRTAVITAPPPAPERPERFGDWPYLAVVRETDVVPDAAARWSIGPAGTDNSDIAFWGPKSPHAGGGHGSKRKAGDVQAARKVSEPQGKSSGKDVTGQDLAGPDVTGRPADGRRPAPRHAAPPAGFGVTLGRRLTSPRFTSRSAAHAG